MPHHVRYYPDSVYDIKIEGAAIKKEERNEFISRVCPRVTLYFSTCRRHLNFIISGVKNILNASFSWINKLRSWINKLAIIQLRDENLMFFSL